MYAVGNLSRREIWPERGYLANTFGHADRDVMPHA